MPVATSKSSFNARSRGPLTFRAPRVRYGRKALIDVACGFGAVGSAIVAVAPAVGVALGTFVSVDWAFVTDTPKADSGRYMGPAVATGLIGDQTAEGLCVGA